MSASWHGGGSLHALGVRPEVGASSVTNPCIGKSHSASWWFAGAFRRPGWKPPR